MIIEGKRNRSVTRKGPEILYSFIYFSPFIWANPSFIALFRSPCRNFTTLFVHNRDQLDRGIEMENPIDVVEILPFLPTSHLLSRTSNKVR